jgi:hypothetical protein
MQLGKGRLADYNRDAKGDEYVRLPQSGAAIERTLPHGAEICATGLVLPDSLSVDQWNEVGIKLCAIDTGLQWAIGDWWAYGHHTYGERKAAMRGKKLNYEFGSLMNLGRVARGVTSSFRNEALSFSHHVAVAALEPEHQKRLLAQALDRKWSVSKLREMIAARHGRAQLDDMNGLDGSDESAEMAIGHNSSIGDLDQIDWVLDFLKRARRAELACPYSRIIEFEALDRATDGSVEEAVKAASEAADAWSEVATSLKGYQSKRLMAGTASAAHRLN